MQKTSYSLFLRTFQKRKLLNNEAFRDFPIQDTSHKTATMSCILRKTQALPTLYILRASRAISLISIENRVRIALASAY